MREDIEFNAEALELRRNGVSVRADALVLNCIWRDRALVRQHTAHDLFLPLFRHCYRVRSPRAFSNMKVKSDWLKKSSAFMSGGRTCWLTALP